MIYEGSILKVTFKDISQHLEEKEANSLFKTFREGTSRHRINGTESWKFWEHITPTSKIIVDYDTIPPQTLRKYNIPTKQWFIEQAEAAKKAEQTLKQSLVEESRIDLPNAIAKDDAVIRSWYLDRLASLQPKDPKTWKRLVNDYTRLSLYLQSASKADRSTAEAYGYTTVPDLYEYYCKCIKRENLHNFNVGTREPGDTSEWKNYQVFMRKLKPFKAWTKKIENSEYTETAKRDALESVISKKFGLKHNEKRTDWHENQLFKIARDGRQLNHKMLRDDLNRLAKQNGYEEVSYETVRLWVNAMSNKLSLAREGNMNWINNKMFIITRDGASVPDALWWIDGTPIELWWYEKKTRRFNRVNMVTVLDDYSRKIIGYAFGNESMDTVYKAIKMAVKAKNTIAYQLGSDHGPAFESGVLKDWFKKVFAGGYGDKETFGHTAATVGLARTKVIEPFFAHFRQTILARDPNHSFGNITSEGPQANPDFVKENFKDFPQSLQELISQITRRVEMWNERAFEKGANAGKSPNQLYELEYDDRRYVNDMWFVDLFYLDRKKSSTYTPEGIEFTWNKRDYKFIAPCPISHDTPEENNLEVAKFLVENDGRKFDMKFDPDDLSKIALYFNGAFHSYAYNKERTKRALYDTTSETGKLLHNYRDVQKKQKQLNQEAYANNDAYADAEGLAKSPFSVAMVHKNERAETDTKIKQMRVSDERSVEIEVRRERYSD